MAVNQAYFFDYLSSMFRLLTAFCLFLLVSPARAGFYTTAFPGYWNDPTVWQNGQIPPLSGNDTIHIRHDLMFVQPLNLASATLLQIDSSGSLCGHYQIIIQAGSVLGNYGELDADTISLPGGHLYNYASGNMLVTYFGLVNNGGGWSNLGGSLQVGANFTCGQKSNGIIENQLFNAEIIPNPAHAGGFVRLSAADPIPGRLSVEIYSLQGERLQISDCPDGIFWPEVKPGIYIVLLFRDGIPYGRSKLVIE